MNKRDGEIRTTIRHEYATAANDGDVGETNNMGHGSAELKHNKTDIQ